LRIKISCINLSMLEIFLINLEHRTDRLKHFENENKKYNFDVSIVSAIDKKDIDRKDYKIKCYRSLTKGQIACYLSHYKVYEKASTELTLVLEDDVKFNPNFKMNLRKVLENAPRDFDVIFLGGTWSWWKRYSNTVGGIENYDNFFYKVNGDMYGAECYLITESAREKLIDNKFPIRYPPGDIPLCRNNLNVYCLKDPIAKQARLGSDTQK
tara:strand:- start:1 stop:633 length:633 start_codon:yes stop_codon:yes gene_type:complete